LAGKVNAILFGFKRGCSSLFLITKKYWWQYSEHNAKVFDTSIGRGEIEGRALWGNIVSIN
jgi:hypothetical protein